MRTSPARLLALGITGAVLLAGLAMGADAKVGVAFETASFEIAAPAAQSAGKLVLVDFYTTWCEPCKRLDEQTWSDAAVGRLVGEKAVALKLDAEKEGKDLAKRYKIDAYPTILVLKPDGTEVDRLIGFREPAKFVQEFNLALAGKPSLTRAVDAVSAAANGHDVVQSRYTLGRELARNGKPAEALTEFLWCFDDGMVKEASFTGVRLSFLLSEIERLGATYPPALAALRERRDAAQQRLLASPAERRACADFASLNDRLGDQARTLEVFDQLGANDPRRAAMGASVFKLLQSKQRYADALAVMPWARMLRQYDQYVAMATTTEDQRLRALQRGLVIKNGADHVEILAGAAELEHAKELAAKVVAFDDTAETKALLNERVTRAGHADLLKPATTP